MKNVLYLDDLSVSQQFMTGSHTLDEAQIKAFAAQFDPQPFHLDAELAKATLFKGSSPAAGTRRPSRCVSWWTVVFLGGATIGLGGSCKWPRPARPGDVLTVYGEITEERLLEAGSRHDRHQSRDTQPTRRCRAKLHSDTSRAAPGLSHAISLEAALAGLLADHLRSRPNV